MLGNCFNFNVAGTANEQWPFTENNETDHGIITSLVDLLCLVFQKKFVLGVWWCSGGLVHYELLPASETVDADLYCCQWTIVMEKVRQLSGRTTWRFRPFLLHDNASPHTTKVTKATLKIPWLPGLTAYSTFSRPCSLRFQPLLVPSVVPLR